MPSGKLPRKKPKPSKPSRDFDEAEVFGRKPVDREWIERLKALGAKAGTVRSVTPLERKESDRRGNAPAFFAGQSVEAAIRELEARIAAKQSHHELDFQGQGQKPSLVPEEWHERLQNLRALKARRGAQK